MISNYAVFGENLSTKIKWNGLTYSDRMSDEEFTENLELLKASLSYRYVSDIGHYNHPKTNSAFSRTWPYISEPLKERKLISVTEYGGFENPDRPLIIKFEEGMEKFLSPEYIKVHAKEYGLDAFGKSDFIIFNEKDNVACMCLSPGFVPIMAFQDSDGNKCIGRLPYDGLDYPSNYYRKTEYTFNTIKNYLNDDIEFCLIISPDSHAFKKNPDDTTLEEQIFKIVDSLEIKRIPCELPIVPQKALAPKFFTGYDPDFYDNVVVLY